MVAEKTQKDKQKDPKDLRYRRQYFPDAEKFVFDTKRRGFVPLPIILRKVLWYLTAPELRVLVYLMSRTSKWGICYPTEEEIAHELGMAGRKNLTPHLRSLERKHFIRTHTAAGKKFFLLVDPRVAIERLAQSGEIRDGRLFEIDDLLEELGQEPLAKVAKTEEKKQAGQS